MIPDPSDPTPDPSSGESGTEKPQVDIDAHRMPKDPRCTNPSHSDAAHPLVAACSSPVEPISDEELNTIRENIRERGERIDNHFWIARLIARIDAAEAELARLRPVIAAAREWKRVHDEPLEGIDGPEVGAMLCADDRLRAALDDLGSE